MRECRNLFLHSLRKEMWILSNNKWHHTNRKIDRNPLLNYDIVVDCGIPCYPFIALDGQPKEDVCEECKKVCNALTS